MNQVTGGGGEKASIHLNTYQSHFPPHPTLLPASQSANPRQKLPIQLALRMTEKREIVYTLTSWVEIWTKFVCLDVCGGGGGSREGREGGGGGGGERASHASSTWGLYPGAVS